MNSPMVVAENVSIHYLTKQARTIRPGRSRHREPRSNRVEAIRDVSFQVESGEVVALVGLNGAGKSTLLRAVAGLRPLDSGRILVARRALLIGVGAVFHKDLSGRRNAILALTALGWSAKEAAEKVQEIFEFAGIERAIDRSLKTYSSGMKARLKFSLATVADPDFVIIDEALSVGDRRFRKQSASRIRQLVTGDTTVMMVSHSERQVRKLADRVIWLEDGRIVADGEAGEVLDRYRASEADPR